MKNFISVFKNKYNRISFSPEQKAHGRSTLEAYVREHPVKSNPWNAFFSGSMSHFFGLRYISFAAMLLVVMLASGGTAYASRQSLPGDLLYPIKVSITEPLETALAVTAEAKIEAELRHSENRLQEADALANEGELNPELYDRLRSRFQAQAERVQDRMQKLEDDGKSEKALEVAARYESFLETHQQILTKLASTVGINTNQVAEIQKSVEAQQKTAAEVRTEAETRISDNAPKQDAKKKLAEVRIDIASRAVERAKDFITPLSVKTNAEVMANAKAQLAAAEAALDKAEVSFAAGEYQPSIEQATEAANLAHEAQTRAAVNIKFKVKFLETSVEQDGEVKGDSTGEHGRSGSKGRDEAAADKINSELPK